VDCTKALLYVELPSPHLGGSDFMLDIEVALLTKKIETAEFLLSS
jgi:hypothetical protein